MCNESEIFQEEKWRNDDAGQFSILILRKLLMGRAQANNIKLKTIFEIKLSTHESVIFEDH